MTERGTAGPDLNTPRAPIDPGAPKPTCQYCLADPRCTPIALRPHLYLSDMISYHANLDEHENPSYAITWVGEDWLARRPKPSAGSRPRRRWFGLVRHFEHDRSGWGFSDNATGTCGARTPVGAWWRWRRVVREQRRASLVWHTRSEE